MERRGCRIDEHLVARHISRAERETAVQLLGIRQVFEGQRVVFHVAVVVLVLDKTCGCTESGSASGMFGVIAWCLCIVNRHIVSRYICRRHILRRRKESASTECDGNKQSQTT